MFLQEIVKDKTASELQTTYSPGKLAGARKCTGSENAPEQGKVSDKKEKFFAPPKPPRVAVTETNPEDSQPTDEKQATKRKAPSPPKEKNGSSVEIKNDLGVVDDKSTSVVKRKAPQPPASSNEASKSSSGMECKKGENKVKNTQSKTLSIDKEDDKNAAPVPAKRERKGGVDSLDDITKINGDQPVAATRKKAQNSSEAIDVTKADKLNGSVKKPKKAEPDTMATIVATPIVVDDENKSKGDKSKQRPQVKQCIIQACVVKESVPEVAAKIVSCENTTTVEAISCGGSEVRSKTSKSERTKVTSVDETERHPRKAKGAEKGSNSVCISAAATAEQKPSGASRKTRQSTKKEDYAFKVPKHPPARDNYNHVDLNETVNLNDVNIHEITFSFDFGQFDQQLEKERDSMFVSYEEKCKQVSFFNFF